MNAALVTPVLALAGVASLPAAEEGLLLRLRLRPGDEWRERLLHEVEVLGGQGEVVQTRRRERVETVRVLDIVAGLGPGAGPAARWARVLRTPEPAPGEAAPPPYEVLMSALGEVAPPPPAPGEEARGAEQAALLAGMAARFAPVLPERHLAAGGSASRTLTLSLAAGAREGVFTEAETTRLAFLGEDAPRGVAVLTIRRRAAPQVLPLADAAAAPRAGALVAVALPAALDLEVLGASGDGELRFGVDGGRLLAYRMVETLGIAARLGGSSVRRTISVRFEIERLEPAAEADAGASARGAITPKGPRRGPP